MEVDTDEIAVAAPPTIEEKLTESGLQIHRHWYPNAIVSKCFSDVFKFFNKFVDPSGFVNSVLLILIINSYLKAPCGLYLAGDGLYFIKFCEYLLIRQDDKAMEFYKIIKQNCAYFQGCESRITFLKAIEKSLIPSVQFSSLS